MHNKEWCKALFSRLACWFTTAMAACWHNVWWICLLDLHHGIEFAWRNCVMDWWICLLDLHHGIEFAWRNSSWNICNVICVTELLMEYLECLVNMCSTNSYVLHQTIVNQISFFRGWRTYPHLPTLTHTYPHLPTLTNTYPHLPTLTHTYTPTHRSELRTQLQIISFFKGWP